MMTRGGHEGPSRTMDAELEALVRSKNNRILDYSSRRTIATTGPFKATLVPETKEMSYGQAVDWWSLGILTVEMLSGLTRVTEATRRMLHARLGLPMLRLLHGLLRVDPGKRLCGFEKVSKMELFEKTDWGKVRGLGLQPPIVPGPCVGGAAIAQRFPRAAEENEVVEMVLVREKEFQDYVLPVQSRKC